ncbi:MAG: DEAD/DEAH box helicase family protein [Gemmataceae bacterium]|nr:DEAD/DEAH box helicase family protein [Gemmataceae bacterium]
MDIPALIASLGVEARPYQERIVSKAVEAFTQKRLRSVLIDSPTGSGKTVMGLLIARAMQRELGVRVGWVAMRRNLLVQAEAENVNRGIGVSASFISMFDKTPPSQLDMLVVDEAQHDAAGSMAHLHNLIRPRYILGLSATPFRADKVKLCFDTVLKDAGIHRLMQDGYLSPYHHYTIPHFTPETVADLYCAEPQRWGKSILYFHTLEQCATAANLLRQRGVRSEVVTGSSDRDVQIEAFRAGKLDVLLNCMVLAEGFDCPELRTVFCRPSCKSMTIQMCGRAFRKHPSLPFKQIVQCQKTRWPFVRTAAAAMQYTRVDGEWRSLQAHSGIDRITGRTLHALARIEVTLPPLIARRIGAQRLRDRRWQSADQ